MSTDLDKRVIRLRSTGRNIFPEEVGLRAFSICADEVERLGLCGIKRKTKTVFRQFVLKNHPDTKRGRGTRGGRHISFWFRKYRQIMNFQYLPATFFNFEKLLELKKGFKNTADIDFGLNGPDDYEKTPKLLSGQVQSVY